MPDERPDPPPEAPKRPQPDPLKKEDKALTDPPARPQPDKLRRIQEGKDEGGDRDGG